MIIYFYFFSGVVGSGVCILSKHPIKETFFHQWSLNGYIHKIHHGDWFGGKGVGLCKIAFHQYTINVYSAHVSNINCYIIIFLFLDINIKVIYTYRATMVTSTKCKGCTS